jgi:dipeptidyl aminopeptidase/acylaminoacyl peptidase
MRRLLALTLLALSATSCGSSHTPGRPAALAYTRLVGNHGSVWVADADGSHARRVAANGDYGRLSPDGRRLTFVRGGTLFLVDLVEQRTRALGEISGSERWAPTGTRLAVSQPDGFFLVDAASGRRTRLLTTHVSAFDFTPDGRSIVLARGKRGEYLDFRRSDLFLLRLPGHRLERLTDDGRSRSPLVSRAGIAYARSKEAYQAFELWLMRGDGGGRRLLARCCETSWYTTHAGTIHGFVPVASSTDGTHLLACQPWEGGCYPVGIDLPRGRRYTFPETTKLGTPKESAEAVDLTRDGRTVLVLVSPWDDEPGPRLLYSVPFAGGKPRLLARDVGFARWRS